METLRVERAGAVARVVLDRPGVRNAFNAVAIAELAATFAALGDDPGIRAIVLAGEGKTFCGGADIAHMRASIDLGEEANVADARAMSTMFRTIDRVPKPVIARIHGAALGGGVGLVACCDVAIAEQDAIFGFTETKLGIMPAVISPFAIAKIGMSHMRALALTGERFSAGRALAIGLVHEVVAADALDSTVARVCAEVLSASPSAIAAAKALLADVSEMPYDATLDVTARAIARQRTTDEGQEGLRAFLDRRPASWVR
jgi:methylglutaconyl-CoA hydratase